MLLAKKPELRGDLIRPLGRIGQSTLEVGVLLLGGCEPFVREEITRTVRDLECFEASFGGKRAATEPRELIAEVPYELFQFVERRELRRYAV